MKKKINLALIFSLVLILILLTTCKRNALEEPPLFGPSSLATLLNVSASPNVISSGTTRETSTITATLKKYDGDTHAYNEQTSQTITFEITNATGSPINVGYFGANEQVSTQVTNASGRATVQYNGPLSQEITGNMTVYILATVSREGKESISEFAPINIIADITEITLTLSANPNVLNADSTRETSTITATLTSTDGTPLVNQTIHFEIFDAAGTKVNIGYFTGNESVISVVTNASGIATTTYSGPLASEITANTSVDIKATVALTGSESLSLKTPISIIREAIEKALTVSPNPNVINAGTARETSTITATLTTVSGDPVAAQAITFEIYDAAGTTPVNIGYFTGNESIISVVTDASGIATTTYSGPLASEITANTTVTIKATAVLEGSESISQSETISIIREAIEKALTVSPNPNVVDAGAAREISTITATLTTVSGDPVPNKTIKFEILDAPLGNKINIGYFGANESVTTAVTDASGIATVTYYGPLSTEITANITVYIQATAFLEGAEFLYESAAINIILDAKTLTVSADPNVIVASATRETSTITATLTTAGGSPVAAQTITFEIYDATGTNPVSTGYFTGSQLVISTVTDASGIATTTYSGPLATEIAANTTVNIKATVALEGLEFISQSTPITIIRDLDVIETRLNISANPTVFNAGAARETSAITATLTTAVGATPLPNWNIRFEICDADGSRINAGYFDSSEQVVTKVTDVSGVATVTYYTPLALEMPEIAVGNCKTVYIRATAWLGETSVTESIPIYIWK